MKVDKILARLFAWLRAAAISGMDQSLAMIAKHNKNLSYVAGQQHFFLFINQKSSSTLFA
jgi:hypothetical protein